MSNEYVHVFGGDHPTQLYMNALLKLLREGERVSPRGKEILELRPAIFAYTNPTNRVTFLNGRVMNPFFQLAESLWILAGRSDVEWLTDYNKSIAQFSDNGKHFNAPYGERLRLWNSCNAQGFHYYGTMDQLMDVYNKISEDPDTRQAVASIYNPLFDHAGVQTKDRPCNMLLTFKLRNGKLDLTVYNRSNDLHWGTFGANLCQFATIQEVMAGWLEVEIGTYYQVSDSLHIYLDDYGAKETEKIMKAYGISEGTELRHLSTQTIEFENEPRISSNLQQFNGILNQYFNNVDGAVRSEETYKEEETWSKVLENINECPDEYLKLTFQSMMAYQAHKKGSVQAMVAALDSMTDSSWKVSCLRFLSKKHMESSDFQELYAHLDNTVKGYIERKDC